MVLLTWFDSSAGRSFENHSDFWIFLVGFITGLKWFACLKVLSCGFHCSKRT